MPITPPLLVACTLIVPSVCGTQVAHGAASAQVEAQFVTRAGDAATTDPLADFVRAIAQRTIDEDGVPGLTIAVARDGELAVSLGFGYADAARGAPATPDTRWPIGSFAHTLTAVAVMQLVDSGKFTLEDDIATLLPDFPVKQHELKLRHLLANTSGIPGWRKLKAKHPEVAAGSLDAADFLAVYADVPFDFEPGTAYSLDTTGYAVLGMILARATGTTLAKDLQTRVIEPIGLMDTGACPAESRPMGYAEDCKQIVDDQDLIIPMPVSPFAGDQSLCSTAADLARWMHAVYDENGFGTATTKAMTTPARTADGDSTGASMAMTVGALGDSVAFVHAGGVGGIRLRVAHYSPDHLTVVVLSNCASAQVEEIEQEIACYLLELPSPNRRDVALSSANIARCVGAYQIATTRVEIRENGGKLVMEWPTRESIELRHRGKLTFALVGEPGSTLVFRVVDDEATSFVLTRDNLVSTGRRMD